MGTVSSEDALPQSTPHGVFLEVGCNTHLVPKFLWQQEVGSVLMKMLIEWQRGERLGEQGKRVEINPVEVRASELES